MGGGGGLNLRFETERLSRKPLFVKCPGIKNEDVDSKGWGERGKEVWSVTSELFSKLNNFKRFLVCFFTRGGRKGLRECLRFVVLYTRAEAS